MQGGGGGAGGPLMTRGFKGHEQRLRERLERLNLDMLIVAGDGNCQVRRLGCTKPRAQPRACTTACCPSMCR